MPARDGAAIRKERIGQLIDLIKNHEDEALFTKDKVIGVFMLLTGNTPERINEYITQLLDLGIIWNEGNKLYYSKKKEEKGE